ncbi:MAG: helix-turn-helix domain-containing protein [Gammaproteobacteria bacterium]|nr:helix-turn-helix domain-containing protein [Gammaproteobacteria bacterium]
MKISALLSDDIILSEIGARIARNRLDRQLTQAALAEQAGVAKRTVERIESGASAQMSSMIRIFRVLGLLPNFDQLIPEVGSRPMDLLKRKGKVRQRASGRRYTAKTDEAWTWDEET